MKIKLPKRFYTPDQLAERWECKVEEVNHQIETGDLFTVLRGAARDGEKGIVIRVYDPRDDWHSVIYEYRRYAHNYGVGPWDGNKEISLYCTDRSQATEAVQEKIKELAKDGSLDAVITAAEVSRFEREHGEPTDDTAPPASWPWGDYETPLLRILADAVTQFCLDGTERYPKKGTDKKDLGEVVNWIKQRMEANGMPSSDQLAGAMETLIAPRIYAHNRQRKQEKP